MITRTRSEIVQETRIIFKAAMQLWGSRDSKVTEIADELGLDIDVFEEALYVAYELFLITAETEGNDNEYDAYGARIPE